VPTCQGRDHVQGDRARCQRSQAGTRARYQVQGDVGRWQGAKVPGGWGRDQGQMPRPGAKVASAPRGQGQVRRPQGQVSRCQVPGEVPRCKLQGARCQVPGEVPRCKPGARSHGVTGGGGKSHTWQGPTGCGSGQVGRTCNQAAFFDRPGRRGEGLGEMTVTIRNKDFVLHPPCPRSCSALRPNETVH
jgi:hypothetical protein